MSRPPHRVYEFGHFRLDVSERLLLREGEPVVVTPKVFDTLLALVEHSGHLVEKDELMERLWPDTFVEEGALTRNISDLRKALGADPNRYEYIETVPKRGYRFVASVRETGDEGAILVVEKTATAHLVIEEEEVIAPDEISPGQALQKAVGTKSEKQSAVRWSRRPAFLAICLLVIGVGVAFSYFWLKPKPQQPESNSAVRSIAVLPFKPVTSEGSDQILELGMADTLITRLSNLNQIVVRPTSAIRKYTDQGQDPIAAGRELRVDSVLEGSIQRLNDRIRVNVRLLRVADGQPLWAYKCDQQCADLFEVQDSVSQRVAAELLPRLAGEEKRLLTKHYTENREAYELYLKGRYFWNKRTREGHQKAIEYFNQAIEIDPTYAQAYAGLGDALVFLGGHDAASHAEIIKKATAATLKALELDETLADAHASLGVRAYDTDFPEAERRLRRAIELNPNHATAHQWYGEFLAYMGRFDEAITEIQRAHEIDPLSLIISTDVAKVYGLARQYDRAIEQYKKTLEIEPNFDEAHGLLGLTYAFVGRDEEAIAELRKIKDLEDKPGYLAWLGYAHGVAGRRREAQRVRERLEELSRRTYVTPYGMTFVDMGLGEKERVFKELEQMFQGHPSGKASLKVNPIYDSLRSDPRFADLIRRVNFPQ